MKNENNIAEAISSSMKEKGLSINRLSALSGVSRTIIYKILNSKNYELSSLTKILTVLEKNITIQ